MGIVQDQLIEVKWHPKNYKHFMNKGYNFTKFGETLYVNVFDLIENSIAKVDVICDYCGKNYKAQYRKLYNNIKTNDKILSKCACCKKCLAKKLSELSIRKYGVSYTTKLDITKQHYIETCIKKYGCKNTFQVEEFKEKSKTTCQKKYGCNYYNQTEEHKNRVKNTSLIKYGYEHFTQNENVKNKNRYTCFIKYGVTHLSKDKNYSKKIQLKRMKTMYKRGNAPCSKQQKFISEVLLNNGVNNDINYAFYNCWLDIAMVEDKIYIEYDGSGHDLSVKLGKCTKEEMEIHDMKRQYFLKNNGWKLIKIKSVKDMLPDSDNLFNLLKLCFEYLNKNNSWIEIDIDKNEIKNSNYIKKMDICNLFKI